MSKNSLGSYPEGLKEVLERWLDEERPKDTVFYLVARDRDIWSASAPFELDPPDEVKSGSLRLEARLQIVPEDRDIWSGTVSAPVEQVPAPKTERGSTLKLVPGD